MKKSDLKLLQSNMQKALKPPPKKKDDLSDELSKMFDDGTVLQSDKTVASSADSISDGLSDAPQLTSAQPGSAHLSSPQLNTTKAETSAQRKKAPIAADRDFNRRPNSIERDALPAGLFPGTSKKLYDALFLRTRGAHNPTRTIQATRTQLMKWAGVGSRNTFLSHMRHLTRVGLLIRRFEIGNNEGAEYEVCIPEEIDLSSFNASTQLTSAHVGSPQPSSTQNLDVGSAQKQGRAEVGQTTDNSEDRQGSKTSFKTKEEKTDDDAALAGLYESLKNAARELTGKDLSLAEKERWRELADVLVAELKIAAARTTVSSVPSFLAEHLRRRLWKIDKKQAHAEGRELPDETVGAQPGIDATGCPDCSGSGWWYPEGEGKGVAKCKHEALAREGQEQSKD